MPDDIPSVTIHDGWLRVHFGGARGCADFHFRWLRHNCDLDRHPQTSERLVDSSELPEDLRITAARIDGDALLVTWAHDHRTSRYKLAWLDRHAYARDRLDRPPPSNVADLEIHRASGGIGEEIAATLVGLAAHGAAVVRRAEGATVAPEDETEAVIAAFAARGLRVVPTHFGRIEDLRTDNTTNENTDQLGYTDAAVDPHTDQPFLETPPRYQLLQAIRAADDGGESALVDAAAAAAYLTSLDAHAAELLRTVPVRFHRKQQAFERVVISPILTGEGDSFRVRYSYFTMAPHQVPFEQMEDWYRAYDRFARLVRDPHHQYRFLLRPGDYVLYDNRRMLHARTRFRGARWVRGIYFDL